MPTRLARYSDIPQMSDVLAASFGPDKLFQVMFPHQKQYPHDFVDGFRTRLRESWWDYSRVLMVSYTVAQSDDSYATSTATGGAAEEVITGIAEWQRVGLGWENVWGAWGWWDPRQLVRRVLLVFHSVRRAIWPNRASAQPTAQDPQPMTSANFNSVIGPFVSRFFDDLPYRRSHWILDLLAVHPSYQGKGFGRELATWGVVRAASDGRPAVVVASEGNENFYRNSGFKLLAGWASEATDEDGNENPLKKRGVGGGAILWTPVIEDQEQGTSEDKVNDL